MEKAFLHHRMPGGTNVFCYQNVKFWWDGERWVSSSGHTGNTIDEVKKAILDQTLTAPETGHKI